jgi:hypothetical protein
VTMTGPTEERSRWLLAMLDPAAVSSGAHAGAEASLERALALLIDARFADYQRLAEKNGWPPFGSWPGPQASPEQRLVAAVALQLSGADVAAGHLADISRNDQARPAIRQVAAIMASITLRDAGRADLSVALLSDRPTAEGLGLAWTLIHLSLALREVGDSEAALAASLSAERAVGRRERETKLGQALRAVAERNTAAFAFAAGKHDLAFARARPVRSWILDRIEARSADGLASFVEQEFQGRLQDPSQLTMTFRQEDPVVTPLMGALLRAEAVGDWYLLQETRKRLGRYQLLASVGVQERKPVPALYLLRRANEVKELQRAIRWYHFEGPLAPIRDFGGGVAAMRWSDATIQSDLVSLREAADLLTPEVATAALDRILGNLEALLAGVANARLETHVYETMAALLPVASNRDADVANRLQPVLSAATDTSTIQSATHLLQVINWEQVDEASLGWWYDYCIEHLAGTTDHRFTSASLIRALPATDRLRSSALVAFQEQPDLLTAANALATGSLPSEVVSRIARIARDQLTRIRADATKGTHGFGAFIDAPMLLTDVLLEYPGQRGWRDLVSFIRDPLVAPSNKVGPLAELSRRRGELPPSVDRRLVAWVRGPVHHVVLPMQVMDQFKALLLRLRFQSNVLPAERLLTDLLALATGNSREGRREAAQMLPLTVPLLSLETALTLALTLSRDPASEVRGAAAWALARLAATGRGPLSQLAWDRVVETLKDPGAIAPQWIIGGLAASDREHWPAGVRAVLADLATVHISHAVRHAAGQLLNASPLPPAASGAARRIPA